MLGWPPAHPAGAPGRPAGVLSRTISYFTPHSEHVSNDRA